MTDAQRKNLDSAIRLAASRIGWAGSTTDIPYALNEAYVTELSRIIVAYPDRFDPQTVATARAELADKPNEALEDYTLGDAAGDFVSGAGEGVGSVVSSVASVGEGVKSALNLTRWLIPLGFVAVAVVLFLGFAKKQGVNLKA